MSKTEPIAFLIHNPKYVSLSTPNLLTIKLRSTLDSSIPSFQSLGKICYSPYQILLQSVPFVLILITRSSLEKKWLGRKGKKCDTRRREEITEILETPFWLIQYFVYGTIRRISLNFKYDPHSPTWNFQMAFKSTTINFISFTIDKHDLTLAGVRIC